MPKKGPLIMLFPHCFSASSHRVAFTALAVLLAGSIAAPAAAQTVPTAHEKQIGVACKNAANLPDFDTLAQCTSTGTTAGAFQKAPLFVGAVTSPPYAAVTCDAAKAGMIQYAASTMQYCNGTSWTTIGTAGAGSLGTAATAASPARSGDAGTGLFSATASTVSIATAGVERLTVTATGSVGIGTTNPNEPLEVASTTARSIISDGAGANRRGLLLVGPTVTTDYARIEAYDYGAASGKPLILNNVGGGRVGIGTTAPGAKLEVKAAASGPPFQVINSDYVPGSAGNAVNIGFGAATGNTYAAISAGKTGWTAWSDLVLQGDGGKVGIGERAPSASLDVNGSAEINGAVVIGSVLTVASNADFNYGEIEIQGTQGSKAPFVRFHRPNEEFGQIRYGTDAAHDGTFYFRNINAGTPAQVKYGTGMVSGWPDVITCHNGANFWLPFYLSNWNTGGTKNYRNLWNSGGDMYIVYNNDGSYNGNVNAGSFDCASGITMSTIITNGRAFLTVRPM